jgi:iron complex transport system substrate-binding protein
MLSLVGLSTCQAGRIVSLAPHATELIAAAGGLSQLVGVTQYCDFPASVKSLPHIASHSGANLEAIVQLKPSAVVYWPSGNRPQDIDALRNLSNKLGFRLIASEPKSLPGIAADIRHLGKALALPAAESAAQSYERELAELSKQFQNAPKRSAFYQLSSNPLYTLNGQHPVSAALALCGLNNIFAELPVIAPLVQREAVLLRQPNLIILADAKQAKAWQAEWSAYASLKTVQYAQADGSSLHRATPRMLPAIRALCDAVTTMPR